MSTDGRPIPSWSMEVLAAPGGGTLRAEGNRLLAADGSTAALIDHGIVRMPILQPDSSIEFYRAVGGARFHERRSVPYAMTTLDTSVYHAYLRELAPADKDGVIVDVGGGDGRNATPWLEWGHRRVVVIDPAFDALARLGERVREADPAWAGRLLLIEGDARKLPLAKGSAILVQAIEALAYLNDDYGLGLAECARLLAPGSRLFVADRDYEAGLLATLFYGGGIAGMLAQASGRGIVDGNAEHVVQSRCFTADEFRAEIEAAGLDIESKTGISALSLLLGYERANGKLRPGDETRLPDVHALLGQLGKTGAFLRSHVVVARKA